MSLFFSSSATCALREDDGVFIFHDPSKPQNQATGNWSQVVELATRILVHEARTNGGVSGTIFNFAEEYANGVINGTITASDEEYANNLIQLIAQLKAM